MTKEAKGTEKKHISKSINIEKRKLKRRKFYLSENLKVELRSQKSTIEGSIIDMSPEGVGIAVEENDIFKVGDFLKLEYKFTCKRSYHTVGIVVSKQKARISGKKMLKLGIKNFSERHTQPPKEIDRANARLKTNSFLTVAAWCEHPFIFNERLFFLVKDFSPEGATLHTSLRNNILLKNMCFILNICISTHGVFTIKCKIKNIRLLKNDNRFRIGIEFILPPTDFKCALGEYLLITHPKENPRSLSKMGFRTLRISSNLNFDYINSKEEMNELLNLRLAAYSADNPNLKKLKPADMLDKFDAYSRIFYCRSHGKMIASGRTTFINNDPSRSEIISKYDMKLPQNIFNKSLIETTKICILPEYRETDLFIEIMKQGLLIALQTGHKYIIGLSMDEQLATYKRMGFNTLGVSCFYKEHSVKINVIHIDLKEFKKGNSVSPIIFKKFKPVIDYFENRELI